MVQTKQLAILTDHLKAVSQYLNPARRLC